MTRMRHAFLAIAVATLAACGGSSYGSPTSPGGGGDGLTVDATPSLSFGPATLTITAGQTVTFAFGSVAHNVFFDQQAGVPSDIEGLNANVSVQRTFATAGTYHYSCHIHPSMRGTIVVQ